MDIDIRYFIIFILAILFIFKNNTIKENFYGWIPVPTRYFKETNNIRGDIIFVGNDENGKPLFYNKNRCD